MKYPCKNRINACDGMDPPFANLSAEETDVVRPVYYPDFSGTTPTGGPCVAGAYLINGVCVEYVPPTPFTDGFGNTEQTARKTCPDGTSKSYTTPAGWFRQATQELANAFALAYAVTQANLQCSDYVPPEPVCPEGWSEDPDNPGHCIQDPPAVIPTCPPGTSWSIQEQECISNLVPPGPPQPPIPPGPPENGCPEGSNWNGVECVPNDNKPKTFFSDPVVGWATCEFSEPFAYILPYGAFKSEISQAAATAMAQSEADKQAKLRKICFDPFVIGCYCLGTQYDVSIVAQGDFLSDTSNVWKLISGSMPPGFTFPNGVHGKSLVITGTPTTAGVYTFRAYVRSPAGDIAYKTFQMSVAGHTGSATLPPATFLDSYTANLTQSGITSNVEWRAESTEHPMPPGLTLDLNGTIHGIPTRLGTFEVDIVVTGTTALNDAVCGRRYTIVVSGTVLATVTLTPEQGLLHHEVLSWHYTDVTASFNEDLGVWPEGDYRWKYISGAFIQYNDGFGDDIYTHASNVETGIGYWCGDYLTYSNGLGVQHLYYDGPEPYPLCRDVGEVQARDLLHSADFTFHHAGGNMSVTYAPSLADLATADNVLPSNSVWSLRDGMAPGSALRTNIPVHAGLPAGDYVFVYYRGHGNYSNISSWCTRGHVDWILDAAQTYEASVPDIAESATPEEAESAAQYEMFTFHHSGGAMYWSLKTIIRAEDIIGSPFAQWQLFAVPTP